MSSGITFTDYAEAKEYAKLKEEEGLYAEITKIGNNIWKVTTIRNRRIYKDIQTGRTPRGSLISKVNDKVHLEIISPEDMNIISPYLQRLMEKEIPYTTEHKEVYSPKHKKYVSALVIEFQDNPQLPPLKLKGESDA